METNRLTSLNWLVSDGRQDALLYSASEDKKQKPQSFDEVQEEQDLKSE